MAYYGAEPSQQGVTFQLWLGALLCAPVSSQSPSVEGKCVAAQAGNMTACSPSCVCAESMHQSRAHGPQGLNVLFREV